MLGPISRLKRFVLALAGTVGLAACGGGADTSSAPPPTGTPPEFSQIRVVHAVPDAPAVDVLVDGTAAIQNLDYAQGTGFAVVSAGSRSVEVRARTPGTTTRVIGPATLTLAANRQYTVLATGTVATIAPLVLERPGTPVATGSARVQVVHAAPAAPRVSVFVTAPGAALAGSAPLGTFAFRESLGPVEVPAGTYQIRVTAAGTTAPVLYDSGDVTLAAGADLLVSAIERTGPGASPIKLAVTTADGTNAILHDRATPAAVRVIHASPDAPAVNVVVNDNFAQPLVSNLAFPQFTPYVQVPAATYGVKVTPASNPGVIAIDASLPLAQGTEYSVYAFDRLATIGATVTTDDRRRLATQAKVRILHGSPTAGRVDIYVTAPGAGIATATPTFANVPFKADTGFVGLAAGSYDVTVTPTGTKTAAIGPATITVANRGLYTVVARDAVGGGAPLGVILLDDFAN
jgi:hypothetical protein